MENVKRTIRLLALVVAGMTISAPVARSQTATTETKSPESVSGTRSASCLLKIVTDPSVLALSPEVINCLFQSSGVRDRTADTVLGLTPEQAAGAALLGVTVLEKAQVAEPISEQRILLRLEVTLPEGVKPAAKEFMAAAITQFQSTIDDACQKEQDRLNKQIVLTDREVDEASVDLEHIQHDLLGFSQDLSSQSLRSSITTITSQLQALQLEMAAKDAYRQALAERISDIRVETEKSLHDDAITVELLRIIERHEVELKDIRGLVESGRVTPTDPQITAIEDKLATARIDLARRREELAKAGSVGSLQQLTGELSTLTLESVQAKAKEKQLDQQLNETQKLLAQAPEYERATLRLDIAKKNVLDAMNLSNKARQRARMFHAPSVSVIGG